jgi:hypothetical protein
MRRVLYRDSSLPQKKTVRTELPEDTVGLKNVIQDLTHERQKNIDDYSSLLERCNQQDAIIRLILESEQRDNVTRAQFDYICERINQIEENINELMVFVLNRMQTQTKLIDNIAKEPSRT